MLGRNVLGSKILDRKSLGPWSQKCLVVKFLVANFMFLKILVTNFMVSKILVAKILDAKVLVTKFLLAK